MHKPATQRRALESGESVQAPHRLVSPGDRQTDRQTDGQTDRWTDRHKGTGLSLSLSGQRGDGRVQSLQGCLEVGVRAMRTGAGGPES